MMSLLPERALNPSPLDEDTGSTERMFQSATEAFDTIVGKRRGIKPQETLVADASGAVSWRDQLAALEAPAAAKKGIAKPQAAAPAATQAKGWQAQLAELEGTDKPEETGERSDFGRGFEVSGKQLKQTAYGAAALIGDTLGSDKLKDWGLKGYKDAEKEVQAISKPTDSFTEAFENGGLGKWLSYSSGYLLGQVAETGAAAIAGGLVGGAMTGPAAPVGAVTGAVAGAIEKGAAQAGIRKLVGNMIDKEATRLVANGVAKEAAAAQATKSVYRTIGANTAATFLNATQELGSIYGEAVQEAMDKGEDYSLGRVWLAGVAATAVDSWADSKMLGGFVKSLGGDKAIKGVAMEALKGGFREGMTEGVQTAIERWGADKDLTSKEAFREYIDSAAVGILGGGISGGASGAINKFTAPADDKGGTGDKGIQGNEITTPESSKITRPDTENIPPATRDEVVSALRSGPALSYLYNTGTDEEKKVIEAALQRFGDTTMLDQVRDSKDAFDAGAAMLDDDDATITRLRDGINQFATNQPKGGMFKVPPRQPMTDEERLKQMDEADAALNQGTLANPPAPADSMEDAVAGAEAGFTRPAMTDEQALPENLRGTRLTDQNRQPLTDYFADEFAAANARRDTKTKQKTIDTLKAQMQRIGFSQPEIDQLAGSGMTQQGDIDFGDADNLYSKDEEGRAKAVFFKDLRKVFFAKSAWRGQVGSRAFRALELHELGAHYSLEKMVGEQRYQELLGQMRALRGKDKTVDAAYASVPQDTAEQLTDVEALGYLIENHADQNVVQRLIQMIKDWYAKTFKGKELTTSDLYAMTVSAYNRHQKEVKRVYLNGEISTAPKAGSSKVDFQTALGTNPEAHQFLDFMTQFGNKTALTGSLAISPQMDIYRPQSNQVHDLDFAVADKQTLEQVVSALAERYPNSAIANQFSSWRTDSDVVSFTLDATKPNSLTVDLFTGRGGKDTNLDDVVSHTYAGLDGQQKQITLLPANKIFEKKLAMNRLKDVNDAIATGDFDTLFSKAKPTVSDLPSALSKVMKTIVDGGVTDYNQVVDQTLSRLRSSPTWAPLEKFATKGLLDQAFSTANSATSSFAPAGVQLTGSSPYLAKDQRKADQANKFIGRGSERSSTRQYAQDFGALANSGSYDSRDVVFVSAEGNRSGRIAPDFAEIGAATQAGATILTDDAANRNRPYNVGERQVAEFLAGQGYNEAKPGVWKPAAKPAPASKPTNGFQPIFKDGKVINATGISENATNEEEDRVVPRREKSEPYLTKAEMTGFGQERQSIIERSENLPDELRGKVRSLAKAGRLAQADKIIQDHYAKQTVPKKGQVAAARRRGRQLLSVLRSVGRRPSNDFIERMKQMLAPDTTAQNVQTADQMINEEIESALKDINTKTADALRKNDRQMVSNLVSDARSIFEGMGMDRQLVDKYRQIKSAFASDDEVAAAGDADAAIYDPLESVGSTGTLRKQKKAEAAPKPQLSMERIPEQLKPLLSKVGSKLNGLLERLSGVSDEWLQAATDPGILEFAGNLEGDALGQFFINLSERNASQLAKVGEKLELLGTPEAKDYFAYKAKIHSIMTLTMEGDFGATPDQSGISVNEAAALAGVLRNTVSTIQRRINEISKMLYEDRRVKDDQGNVFESTEQGDDNAYLWGDQGFRIPRNMPRARLEAMLDQLNSELRAARTRSTAGLAKLLRQAANNAYFQLQSARKEALQNGIPPEAADPPYIEARDSLLAMREPARINELAQIPSVAEALNNALDGLPDEASTVIDQLVEGIRDRSMSADEMFRVAAGVIRSGEMTYQQIVEGLRARGLAVPQEMIRTVPTLAFQIRLQDYVQQNGGKSVYRRYWLSSMDMLVKRNPSLLNLSVFTEAERILYRAYRERIESLKERRTTDMVMEGSDKVEEAFRDLLFTKYTLGQMSSLAGVSEGDKIALESFFGADTSARENAWFEDVAFALETRPSLAEDIIGEEGILAPTDVRRFQEWQQRKQRSLERSLDQDIRRPYIDALNNIDSALPEGARTYTVVRKRLESAGEGGGVVVGRDSYPTLEEAERAAQEWTSQGNGFTASVDSLYDRMMRRVLQAKRKDLDQILASAHELYTRLASQTNASPSVIDEVTDSFILEEMHQDEMINGQTIDEYFGVQEGGTRQEYDPDYYDSNEPSVGPDIDFGRPMLRQSFFGGRTTGAVVNAVVERIRATWKNAPQIIVVPNSSMLPEPLRSAIEAKLNPGMGAQGAIDTKTGMVYLFSDHISSSADAEFVLFHEVYGHLGLRAILGEKFDSFLENMYRTYPDIRRAVDVSVASGTPKLEAIEEVVADMAGTNPEIGPVKQFVGKMIAGLREIGLNRVADWAGKLTSAELSYHLASARDAVRNGTLPALNGAPGEFRLSQTERIYEMFATKGEKATGYARFNPVTQSWIVFSSGGNPIDIRTNGYSVHNYDSYEEALSAMQRNGKVDRRKRSGRFVDEKLPGDLPNLLKVTDITGVKRWMRDQITRFQNEYRPVFDVVDYLKAQGRLTDQMDVKTALMLYERRTGAVVEDFRTKYVEPLMKLVEKARSEGADSGEVDTFLLARHAEERNKQIASINPKMPDKGSGMYTEDANKFLEEVAQKPYFNTLQEIGRLTDKMSDAKLSYQVQTGMITAKVAEKMRRTYKHYVNLSGQTGNKDKFDDPSRLAGGSKFNVKGKEARAYGRSEPASDILARTILGMEAALIRGQKNEVAQRLLTMLEANYDPNFVSINEVAYVRKEGEDGMVMEVEDENYIGRKDVMVAKVGGIPVTMRFKDTSRGSFADAIHGMVYPPESNAFMEKLGQFNRVIGQMLTTYNPAWAAVNFVRDAQTMYFNAASDGRITRAQAARMVKLLPKAIKVAYFMASNRSSNIKVDPALVATFNEMKREGGLTTFLNRKDLEQQAKEIEGLLKEPSKWSRTKDGFGKFLKLAEFITTPMEIAPRLVAYQVAKEGGMSMQEAAKFSGEITVNFNMRGSNRAVRQLYLFFNPAVQGSAKLGSLFFELGSDYKIKFRGGKASQYAMGFVALGAIANLVGRAMGDDDEEDGINSLDKVPVYKRATSIVISPDTPGAAIPIPYGWNAFYALGHFGMDAILGVQPISTTAKRIIKSAFEAFTPMGTAGLDSSSLPGMVAKGVAPTATLPILEWVMNENRFGAPIYRDDSLFGGAKMPNSESAFRSVSPISQGIARGFNEISGGNKARAGLVDVNPAAIDFLISSYMPGMINELYKGASVGVRAARGEEIKSAPMPVIDRFTAKIPESYDAGAFRRAKELSETRWNEWKLYPDRRDQIREELPGLQRAHAVVASTTQEIRRLRANFAAIENNPTATPDEIVERKNALREREKMLYSRAVKAVMEAGPEFKDALIAND